MKTLPAPTTLDLYYLETRACLLDIAAILDRLNRGDKAELVESDPRLKRMKAAIQLLQSSDNNRAEQIQQLFSLPYDPTWAIPKPRT